MTVYMRRGQKEKLLVYDTNYQLINDDNINWSSGSFPHVATVNKSGIVTAHDIGTTVITAETVKLPKVKRFFTIHVKSTNLDSAVELKAGSTALLCSDIPAGEIAARNPIWRTSNDRVVKIHEFALWLRPLNSGKTEVNIYAAGVGKADVTLSFNDLYNDGRSHEERIMINVLPGRLIPANPDVFWCQTGGWEIQNRPLAQECARTAVATMASLNTGFKVTPNKVTEEVTNVEIDGQDYGLVSHYNSYDVNTGAHQGFNRYTFSDKAQILSAINCELDKDRAVVVRTNGTTAEMHWVTVTETKDGKTAKSFADLMGIDPWYNGTNPPNDAISPHLNKYNLHKNGVITLTEAFDNQTDFLWGLNPNLSEPNNVGYCMFTVNFD
ncbi:MAG: Ig-like domain-containing protein [Oscillospiraceae bacterium]|nr:Ig-like domain-containing protein [Oscillospiraceae bacterium]